jgi:hypothetical protein
VPIGDPAPATPAGTVPVWVLTTDGTSLTNSAILLPTFPVFNTIGVTNLFAALLQISGDADIGGNLTVNGNATLGDNIADTTAIAGPTTVGGTLGVTGVATLGNNVNLGTDVGAKTVTIGADASDVLTCPAVATLSDNVNLCTGVGAKTLVVGSDSSDVVTVNSTATFNAPVTVANGQLFTANGNVILGNAGGDTIALTGSISCVGDITISSHSITGTAGSLVDVENVAVTEVRFDSSGSTLPSVAGRMRWNDTLFTFMDAQGIIRAVDEPVRGYDAVFQSINTSIGSTTASATRRIKATEPVWIEMGCRRQMSTTVDMNYRIRATGPLGTIDILSDSVGTPTANKGLSWHEVFYWTPTDTWPGETDPQNYTFVVGLGGAGGASTLDAVRVGIKVSSAVQV